MEIKISFEFFFLLYVFFVVGSYMLFVGKVRVICVNSVGFIFGSYNYYKMFIRKFLNVCKKYWKLIKNY